MEHPVDAATPRNLRPVKDFDLNLLPPVEEAIDETHTGILQRFLNEQEKVEINMGLLHLRTDRPTAVGPIRKRPLRRCKLGGSTSKAPHCYRNCPSVCSDGGSGTKQNLTENVFPEFGLRYTPTGITYCQIRAGMSMSTLLGGYNTNASGRSVMFPDVIQAVPTFGEYANAMNPWLRNTVHFRESIPERCRNYAARHRQHPYNPYNPTPNLWNSNVPSDVMSEESRVMASPADLEEVVSLPRNNHVPATRRRSGTGRRVQHQQQQLERRNVHQPPTPPQPQTPTIYHHTQQPGILQQLQPQIGNGSTLTHLPVPMPMRQQQQIVLEHSRCMYCLKQMTVPLFNRGPCGHGFCMQCLLEEKGSLGYYCFHCRWTAIHSS